MTAARGSSRAPLALVLSCEYGGNVVPRAYRAAFAVPPRVLASHRGHDPGTAELGAHLAAALGAPLVVNRVTRLLLDTNRSADNPGRASPCTDRLPEALVRRAEREVWASHRDAVAAEVAQRIAARGRVLRVSVHSFTPRLRGVVRDVDVGLLFDPARTLEADVAERWLAALAPLEPRLRLARNRPYLGTDDGLTTTLRGRHSGRVYAGLELEVSQRFPRATTAAGRRRWERLMGALAASLESVLGRPSAAC